MRFFKKFELTKENRRLGDEYMPNGSIRVLNPYEVYKNVENEHDTCKTEVFKRIESRKGPSRLQDGERETARQRNNNDDDNNKAGLEEIEEEESTQPEVDRSSLRTNEGDENGNEHSTPPKSHNN